MAAGSFLTFAVGISEMHQGRMKLSSLLTLLLHLCASSSVSITVWSFITLLKWDSGACSSLPPALAVGLTLSNYTICDFVLSEICCLPTVWHHTPGRPVRSLLFSEFDSSPLGGEREVTWLLVLSNLCLYFLPFHIDHLQSPFADWFIHLAQCPFFPMLSLPRLPWPSSPSPSSVLS